MTQVHPSAKAAARPVLLRRSAALLLGSALLVSGCQSKEAGGPADSASPSPAVTASASPTASAGASPSTGPTVSPSPSASPKASTSPSAGASASPPATPANAGGGTNASSLSAMSVLVNKSVLLPSNYIPSDLIYPDVPFSFNEKIEKRMMRAEAAHALEKLFAGAKKDGFQLYGVSAYRSYATQKTIYANNVKNQGEEEANKYSAKPGTSEHQTGLSIDVSSQSAKFGLEEEFGTTAEGKWLAKHASEYGFIIRYPKGKEAVTGYNYEPWHIRYVGLDMAKEIAKQGITLEEYLNAKAVSK